MQFDTTHNEKYIPSPFKYVCYFAPWRGVTYTQNNNLELEDLENFDFFE